MRLVAHVPEAGLAGFPPTAARRQRVMATSYYLPLILATTFLTESGQMTSAKSQSSRAGDRWRLGFKPRLSWVPGPCSVWRFLGSALNQGSSSFGKHCESFAHSLFSRERTLPLPTSPLEHHRVHTQEASVAVSRDLRHRGSELHLPCFLKCLSPASPTEQSGRRQL